MRLSFTANKDSEVEVLGKKLAQYIEAAFTFVLLRTGYFKIRENSTISFNYL